VCRPCRSILVDDVRYGACASALLARVAFNVETEEANQGIAQDGRDGQCRAADARNRWNVLENLAKERLRTNAIEAGGARLS
jgi:hypothetical protein